MDLALARFHMPELPPLEEILRAGTLLGCALALIFAGPLLPF